MNRDEHTDDYRSFLILEEISKNNVLTQRDMSKRLGVALGLVNSYIKNLVSKGYITVSTIPRKRYKYYLTPSGFTEKTRLTYQHLHNFTNLYRTARKDFQKLFGSIKDSNIRRIVFCGVDEVTEIAFLSLNEAGLELTAIIGQGDNKKFFGHEVLSLEDIKRIDYDVIIITCFRGGDVLKNELLAAGVDEKDILEISAGGWLKKIEGF